MARLVSDLRFARKACAQIQCQVLAADFLRGKAKKIHFVLLYPSNIYFILREEKVSCIRYR